jgi:hypothetical protein
MEHDRDAELFWMGVGGLFPIAAAMALVPLRGVMLSTNVALVLVTVVVVVAAAGGWQAGAVAAVTATLSFDFLYTVPYQQLRMTSADDIETTILLLAVGLIVGHVAARGRRARSSAEARRGEVRRIYRMAQLVARGDEVAEVIMAAQAELTALLHLRGCRFQGAPVEARFEQLERGDITCWRELPAEGVELAVIGRGQQLGRFVLDPTPGTSLSLEQRVVAVAVADQVGAVLAAPLTHGSRN